MNLAMFRSMFPAFENLDDGTILIWSDIAGSFLQESWVLSGKQFVYAKNMLIAHLIYLAEQTNANSASGSNGGGAVGVVSSATEGSVSVSFSMPQTKNAWQFWLASSPYGLQLWALLKQLSIGGFYIGGLPERKAVRKVGGVWL